MTNSHTFYAMTAPEREATETDGYGPTVTLRLDIDAERATLTPIYGLQVDTFGRRAIERAIEREIGVTEDITIDLGPPPIVREIATAISDVVRADRLKDSDDAAEKDWSEHYEEVSVGDDRRWSLTVQRRGPPGKQEHGVWIMDNDIRRRTPDVFLGVVPDAPADHPQSTRTEAGDLFRAAAAALGGGR